MLSKKTFYIETFGCQMNVHDSEKVAGTLLSSGYVQVDSSDDAELVLYNTCSIREKAAQKVFHRLDEFKRAKGGGKTFAVIGCVAQQEGEKIFEAAPHVSLVAGSASYPKIAELLAQVESGNRRVTGLSLETDQTFETEMTRRDSPFRAYITIIEGCDKHCAYCVVPFTRGPERSRTSASVLEEARRIVDGGYSEILLLGQNVNSYRDPSSANISFADLLVKVSEVPGIRRVRFTTSHPRDFTREIVQAIESTLAVCNHVHLPVQSGSSSVLRRMAREYTREEYLERIEWMHSSSRPITITTDIIVGFPGETPEEFEQSISLMDTVGFDAIFAFHYSPRPNTSSLAMKDSIPEEEKALRLKILQDRQRTIQSERNQRFVGLVEEVLIEGRNKNTTVSSSMDGSAEFAPAHWKGRTSNNMVLNFAVPSDLSLNLEPGDYAQVRVTKASPNSLMGVAVSGDTRSDLAVLSRSRAINVRAAESPFRVL